MKKLLALILTFFSFAAVSMSINHIIKGNITVGVFLLLGNTFCCIFWITKFYQNKL